MSPIIALIAIIAAIIAVTTMPVSIMAASMSDSGSSSTSAITAASSSGNNTNTGTSTQALSTTGTTEQPPSTKAEAKTLVLTAVADKPLIKAGASQTIHVRAAMENGTGIPDVNIQTLVQQYNSSTQKVLLGGQTNDKGVLDMTAAIGPHAKSGQFLIIANASKGDLKSSVASGFAVSDIGSSSSSSSSGSSSSSSKCSGSSCK